jgi:glutaredoxin-related protein
VPELTNLMMMIKMYVMKSCPYCAYVLRQVKGNPEFKVIDIGEDIHDLKTFLDMRDHAPEFAEARAEGDVGVPCYVREDGSITLMSHDVGLEPLPD